MRKLIYETNCRFGTGDGKYEKLQIEKVVETNSLLISIMNPDTITLNSVVIPVSKVPELLDSLEVLRPKPEPTPKKWTMGEVFHTFLMKGFKVKPFKDFDTLFLATKSISGAKVRFLIYSSFDGIDSPAIALVNSDYGRIGGVIWSDFWKEITAVLEDN